MATSIRRAADRGTTSLDWLDSRHSFSFGGYHDPAHMGFGPLRVINDDRVAPGGGFGMHGHRDMEIVTWVLSGALEHRDSLGNGSVIRPGDAQRMSAGTGILHSEFNASKDEPVRFLQIWILPERGGLPPGYEQRAFDAASREGRLRLIASRDAREGSVMVHRDVDLYASLLRSGQSVAHRLSAGRGAWLQVARGRLALDGAMLDEGDGAAITTAGPLEMRALDDAEFLLFDMGA